MTPVNRRDFLSTAALAPLIPGVASKGPGLPAAKLDELPGMTAMGRSFDGKVAMHLWTRRIPEFEPKSPYRHWLHHVNDREFAGCPRGHLFMVDVYETAGFVTFFLGKSLTGGCWGGQGPELPAGVPNPPLMIDFRIIPATSFPVEKS